MRGVRKLSGIDPTFERLSPRSGTRNPVRPDRSDFAPRKTCATSRTNLRATSVRLPFFDISITVKNFATQMSEIGYSGSEMVERVSG